MKTLYDVLGVSAKASADQIEHAYRYCLDSLSKAGVEVESEDGMVRAKAIREAHQVLSSAARRQAYDASLERRQQVTYEVVEEKRLPWIRIAALAILVAGGLAYKIHEDNARTARMAIAAQQAQAEAEAEEKRAAAEQAKLAQQRLQEERIAQDIQRREREKVLSEGRMNHERLQRMQAETARERERAEQLAKYERQREEAAAQARKRNEIYAMERALAIPIRRH